MAKKGKKMVSEINYENFDGEITAIAEKSLIVKKSINNSLHVDEDTLYQIIKV